MDFKSAYKKEMDDISPSEGTLEKLARAGADPSRHTARTFWYKSATTWLSAAAVVIVVAGLIAVAGLSKQGRGGVGSPLRVEGSPYHNLKLVSADTDYANVYALFESQKKRMSGNYAYEDAKGGGAEVMSTDAGVAEMDGALGDSDTTGLTDYSGTNIQVAGVQEADIVKTDGRYIYALGIDYLYILESNEGTPKVVSKVRRAGERKGYVDMGAFEMYVTSDRLIVLTTIGKIPKDGEVRPMDMAPGMVAPDIGYSTMPAFFGGDVTAVVYDISDKSEPKKLKSFSQSGSYANSRMIGDNLYLVSNHAVYDYDAIDPDKPATYVPSLAEDDASAPVKSSDMVIYPDIESTEYTVITGIDVGASPKRISNKTLLGFGSTMYVSLKNMYLITYSQIEEPADKPNSKYVTDGSDIVRVAIDKGRVEVEANAQVKGTVLNQFSMDEREGVLRIVTTAYRALVTTDSDNGDVWMSTSEQDDTTTALYTLDSNLEVLGSISDIAPGERVYSARFMGELGYFVTFRQVDPLFSVDLSDPSNPTIIGALKIPGFSNYLHSYSEGRLFGLGSEADEKTGMVGDLKLSMFDTTNPRDVTERHTLVLRGVAYSEASYNHKAILINADKSIIAFPSERGYLVYSYSDDDGFKKQADIALGKQNEDLYQYNLRGLYIGDYLYVVAPVAVGTYDLKNYDAQSLVRLK